MNLLSNFNTLNKCFSSFILSFFSQKCLYWLFLKKVILKIPQKKKQIYWKEIPGNTSFLGLLSSCNACISLCSIIFYSPQPWRCLVRFPDLILFFLIKCLQGTLIAWCALEWVVSCCTEIIFTCNILLGRWHFSATRKEQNVK